MTKQKERKKKRKEKSPVFESLDLTSSVSVQVCSLHAEHWWTSIASLAPVSVCFPFYAHNYSHQMVYVDCRGVTEQTAWKWHLVENYIRKGILSHVITIHAPYSSEIPVGIGIWCPPISALYVSVCRRPTCVWYPHYDSSSPQPLTEWNSIKRPSSQNAKQYNKKTLQVKTKRDKMDFVANNSTAEKMWMRWIQRINPCFRSFSHLTLHVVMLI